MSENITSKQLMAKARGFTVSIEKMNDTQRGQRPNGAYGEDYNRLRSLTIELVPNLAKLLPPPVETYVGADGESKFTSESYGEIDTYCEQIFQLLSEQE